MTDRILDYYEQELTFIRAMGAEFAIKYPKIAGRLLLEPDKCEDPYTERLIEAFALISARIHQRIDDDFPEVTQSLLNVVYPHYTNPIPSMTVVQFDAIGQNIPPSGYPIEKDSALFSKPVSGIPCQFTTRYPVTLWPIQVVTAGLREPKKLVKDAQQAILIQLRTFNGLKFSQLGWEDLRFFLNGPYQHIFHLYELLFNHACQVEFESMNRSGVMQGIGQAPESLRPVGFDPEAGMLPFQQRSFPGYLQLLEYFCFPEKFLFFDLTGLGRIRGLDAGDTLDIWIYLSRRAKSDLVINKETFCIHAAPAINLFRRIAEPVRVEQRKTEYRVIADIRRQRGTEVYSVDRVTASSSSSPGKEEEFRPFYSLRHHLEEDEAAGRRTFWHLCRRPSGKKGDDGTEVYISFGDLGLKPEDPGVDILTVHITCTNRDLPGRLPFGDPSGDYHMEVTAPVQNIHSLIKPTPTRRPFLGGELQWRLISHLSLNYLSLVQGGEDALKEMLKLYDFDNSPATRQQIEGILSVRSEQITKRIGRSFCRGVRVTLEFDEDKYVGVGLYLFASVLERFLGQYVSVNSFSQLVARTLQKKEPLKQWPPRSGNRILL